MQDNTPTQPKHGDRGTYRQFYSKERDRFGHDLWCACCNTWNTVEGTGVMFSLLGKCKNCGAPFGDRIGMEKMNDPETCQ